MDYIGSFDSVIIIFVCVIITILCTACTALNLHYVHSPFVERISKKQEAESNPTHVIVAISDIQCRNKKECAELDEVFTRIRHLFEQKRGAKRILIVAGDMTDRAMQHEIEDWRKKEALTGADEIYKICGNHDVQKGIGPCMELLAPQSLWYRRTIGANISLYGLSNMHERVQEDNNMQRHIPQNGISFFTRNGKKDAERNRMIFLATHQKIRGIGTLSDPRSWAFWRKHDQGSTENSSDLKHALQRVSRHFSAEDGIQAVWLFGHAHAPPWWFDTVFMYGPVLCINTSAIRTTTAKKDWYEATPERIIRYLFGIPMLKTEGPVSRALGKTALTLVPRNQKSVARVMYLTCGSNKMQLYTRNLTDNTWFNGISYEITLASPFKCE